MMAFSRHLMVLLRFAGAVALFVVAGQATAQETTSAQEEVLRRHDSSATAELAAALREAEAREAELEAELAALEESGDYGGPEWISVNSELAEMPSPSDLADSLASARLADIAASPLPEEDAAEKAAELRRKAQSADAVDNFLDTVRLNTTHENYVLFGPTPAQKMSETYRREAAALEVGAESEEAAREAARPAEGEEGAEETGEDTTGAAPPGGAGEDPGRNPSGEPGVSGGGSGEDGGGPLSGLGRAFSGFSLVSLLAAALIAVGVGYYVIGLVREGLGSRVRRFGAPQQATAPKAAPKKPAAKPRQAPGEATERPGSVSAAPGEFRGSSGREDSPGPSRGHVTPATEAREATDSSSPEALSAWFNTESPEEDVHAEEEKRESRRGERRRRRRGGDPEESPEEVPGDEPAEAPGGVPEKSPKKARKKDVNQLVAEEVARMRAAGELGPEDEVVVTMEAGRIKVRRKE